jgi:pyruvate/2-oxoacid:ferredoxin oxidoreductase beta subunit
MSQILIREQVPQRDLLVSGHLACPGCGGALAMKLVLNELGPDTILVLPACCWSVIAGPYPQCSVRVPVYHTAFETGAAVASGVRAALDLRGDTDTTVLVWAGDGGTFDIGLQSLSGAAERNENILYRCYDSEAYTNTGIQRSSATPRGAWTTTTPAEQPQSTPKKDILGIMATHRIPYAATTTVAHPLDLLAKVRRAWAMRGLRFLHILAPCPPGWKYPDEDSLEMARMAVRVGLPADRGGGWHTLALHGRARGRGCGGIPAAPGPLPPPERGAGAAGAARRGCPLGAAPRARRGLVAAGVIGWGDGGDMVTGGWAYWMRG